MVEAAFPALSRLARTLLWKGLAIHGGEPLQYRAGGCISPPFSAWKLGKEMPTSAIDVPLTVSTSGMAGPYVIVTPDQYSTVAEALRAEGVHFQADESAIRLNGAPALAVIDLGPGADIGRVQDVLDRVAAELHANGVKRRRSPTRKELVVRGDPAALRELRRRFSGTPVGGWARRSDVEERLRKTLTRGTSGYCFSKAIPPVRREVAVLVQGRRPGEEQELYVSGIVPLEGRDALDFEQQDLLVSDFRSALIEPLLRDLSVRILDYRVQVEPALEETLSLEALGLLRVFSAAANKGDLHPLDLRRWAAFIARTHLDDAVIDLRLLAAWLEEDGFPDEQRDRLIDEYEAGRRLLSAYDEERSS